MSIKHISKKYFGKYFSIMGDSISTFEGVSPAEYNTFYTAARKCESNVLHIEDTWWGRVIDALGGELLVDNAFSGSLVCKLPFCEIESYGASDQRTAYLGEEGKTPDVVMAYIGTNDWGWNVPIERTDSSNDDLSAFAPAYALMLSKIKKNYPNADIWCFTLVKSDDIASGEFVLNYTKNGRPIEAYNEAIRRCAAASGCRLIDLAKYDFAYETFENVHPDYRGMKTIADYALKEICLFL